MQTRVGWGWNGGDGAPLGHGPSDGIADAARTFHVQPCLGPTLVHTGAATPRLQQELCDFQVVRGPHARMIQGSRRFPACIASIATVQQRQHSDDHVPPPHTNTPPPRHTPERAPQRLPGLPQPAATQLTATAAHHATATPPKHDHTRTPRPSTNAELDALCVCN